MLDKYVYSFLPESFHFVFGLGFKCLEKNPWMYKNSLTLGKFNLSNKLQIIQYLAPILSSMKGQCLICFKLLIICFIPCQSYLFWHILGRTKARCPDMDFRNDSGSWSEILLSWTRCSASSNQDQHIQSHLPSIKNHITVIV